MTLTIDPANLARLKEDEAAAIAAGFSPKPPIYALGTPVIQLGQDNFQRSRQDFEKLPRAGEALEMLVQRVRDENRQDVQTQLRSLSMDAEGFLSRGSGKLFMTPNSLKQVIARTDCTEPYAAATYLATIPPRQTGKGGQPPDPGHERRQDPGPQDQDQYAVQRPTLP